MSLDLFNLGQQKNEFKSSFWMKGTAPEPCRFTKPSWT